MKAVINEKETAVEKPKYPWIGKGKTSKLIVGFWSENKATCLLGSGDYVSGESYPASMWELFTPFT